MSKNLFFFLICISLLASFSYSVFPQTSSFKWGLRAGLSFPSVNENYFSGEEVLPETDEVSVQIASDQRRLNTYNAGLYFEYWFSSKFIMQLNALYSRKGVKVKSEMDGFAVDNGQTINVFMVSQQTLDLAYFSAPIMVKYVFGRSGSARPFITVGPEIGYLLSAETSDFEADFQAYITELGGGAFEINEPGGDVKDDLESIEVAFNFGAGFIIPVGQMDLFLDGWYSLGLTKINKEGEKDIKNNVITLNVGLGF
jgi:hypothetical protein